METEAEIKAETDAEMDTEIETETTETDSQYLSHWQKVVRLICADLREGRLMEEAIWKSVVLIPRGRGYY